MNPSLRSQLRDGSAGGSAQAQPRSPIATAHRCSCSILTGSPAATESWQNALPGFRLHYAVKALPHPACCRRSRSAAAASTSRPVPRSTLLQRARSAHGPLHPHPPGQEARGHRPRLRGRHPHVRRRQPLRGTEIRGPAGRHRAACAAGVPQSGREVRPVDEIRRRAGRRRTARQARYRRGCAVRGVQLPRRQPERVGAALRHGAERHARRDLAHRRDASACTPA